MKNMSNSSHTMTHTLSHSMTEPKEIVIMLIIMFIAGLLSSMNVWVDKLSDMRFHLNDVYMSLLMCGWSLILMGIYYINPTILLVGILFTFLLLYCIRNQLFIDESQYVKGMIPHHSMAMLMSKELLKKAYNRDIDIYVSKDIKILSNNIINSQNHEINIMKSILQDKIK
jgi:hypothetical protein